MQVLLSLLLSSALLNFVPAEQVTAQDACASFYKVLKDIPHQRLTRSRGEFDPGFSQGIRVGCEVRFVTRDSLLRGRETPDFLPLEGTRLYKEGWRANNSLIADGPGSSIFGIEKGQTRCIVSDSQPSYVDDDGKIVHSETLTITVQCFPI